MPSYTWWRWHNHIIIHVMTMTYSYHHTHNTSACHHTHHTSACHHTHHDYAIMMVCATFISMHAFWIMEPIAIHVSMYDCIHRCMYTQRHVSMYDCIHICMYTQRTCQYVWLYPYMYVHTTHMSVCMTVSIYVCTHNVHVSVCIHSTHVSEYACISCASQSMHAYNVPLHKLEWYINNVYLRYTFIYILLICIDIWSKLYAYFKTYISRRRMHRFWRAELTWVKDFGHFLNFCAVGSESFFYILWTRYQDARICVQMLVYACNICIHSCIWPCMCTCTRSNMHINIP